MNLVEIFLFLDITGITMNPQVPRLDFYNNANGAGSNSAGSSASLGVPPQSAPVSASTPNVDQFSLSGLYIQSRNCISSKINFLKF